MEILETEFKESTKNYGLRLDPNFYIFVDRELPLTIKQFKFPVIRFGELINKINNGKDVTKEEYSVVETNYVYLTVNNIRKYEIIFKEIIYLGEETGERLKKNKLEKGDLIITRSGTVGLCKLFDIKSDKIYIPSGYLIVVKLKEKLSKKFVEYYLSHNFIEKYIQVHATGKTQQNISQAYIKKIPIPKIPREIELKIIKKIEKIEEEIKEEKQKLVSLQDVIEEVFIKYGIKSSKFEKKEFEAFITDSINIGKQKFLRYGPQYRAFWDVHKGLLFEDKTKYKLVKLDSVIKLHKTKTLKKGILDKEYILIELEDIESGSGRIINKERIVSEIGSDKTYFNECDLITTKLRPYLGYTILNKPELELIGTTELLPFKIKKELAYPEYIKYVLLSYEYLEKSGFLMHGKEHPRIHPLDIINIKIPLPSLEIQKKIVNEIQKQEKINEKAKKRINELREEINKTIFEILKDKREVEKKIEQYL
jgi:restriction endonuclease S subunit